jgi:quinate dehydrogenase (quinone)
VEQVNTLQRLVTGSRDSARAQRVDAEQRGARVGRVVGAVIAALGLTLAGGGLWLLMLGGSAYYILSGIGYVVSGVLLWRRRPAGAWLSVAVFAATVAWALWEVGFSYWTLFPRVSLPAGLALLALLATLRFPANKSWRIAAHTAGVLGLLIGSQFAFAFVPHGTVHTLPSRPFVSPEPSNEPSNRYSYGRTNTGTRYAPFTQINPDNVQVLKPVWTFHSGDGGPGVGQNTSLQIGELIYVCVRADRLMAINGDSGKIRWRYDSGAEHVDWAPCRGLGLNRENETC